MKTQTFPLEAPPKEDSLICPMQTARCIISARDTMISHDIDTNTVETVPWIGQEQREETENKQKTCNDLDANPVLIV